MQTLQESAHVWVDDKLCTFTIIGTPRPGGSKKVVPKWKKFPVTVRDVKHLLSLVGVVDDNDEAKKWKEHCRTVARLLFGDQPPYEGPLTMNVQFYLKRPAAHWRTNGELKDWARDERPDKRPDATKLIRCLEDGLTGVVWADDAQIVSQLVTKEYVTSKDEPERAIVFVGVA